MTVALVGGNVVSQDTPTDRYDAQGTFDDYQRQLAARARDTGMARAESADAEWADAAFAWIDRLPVGSEFDADDVRSEFGPSAASGSVFRRAARARLIEVVGITTSRARTRHGGISRKWRRT